MKLTQKLLTFIHRVFDKSPQQFLALRLTYAGSMTWKVEDGVLTTAVVGGPGHGLSIDLSQYTLATLVNFLAAQAGYAVLFADMSDKSLLSATVLIDAAGDISQSNGDHISGYTSLLWAYLESAAVELRAAQSQIVEMIKQLSTRDADGNLSAAGEWQDEIGGYYGIPRIAGEPDTQYGPRIIAEVLRPRGNNVALEAAIAEFTGQPASITDVTLIGPADPLYNGAILYDGSRHYDADTTFLYGLFDAVLGYDLLGGMDVDDYKTTLEGIIDRLRDAGTHLRSLLLAGSAISDALTPPTEFSADPDSLATLTPLTDPATDPDDTSAMTFTWVETFKYEGARFYNGGFDYTPSTTATETL